MTRYLTHWCIWLALSLMLVVTPLVTAHAQGGPCGMRADMLEQLESTFGEVLAGQGVIGDGTMTGEFTVNPADGSWTVIVTRPDGLSCVVIGGKGWEFFLGEEKPKGQPS